MMIVTNVGASWQKVADAAAPGIGARLLFKACPAESGASGSPRSAPRLHVALRRLYARSGSPRQDRNHAGQPSQVRTLHRIRPSGQYDWSKSVAHAGIDQCRGRSAGEESACETEE